MKLILSLCASACLIVASITPTLAKDDKTDSLAKRIKKLEQRLGGGDAERQRKGVVLDKKCKVPFVTNGSIKLFGIEGCTTPPTAEDLERERENDKR